MFGGSRRVKLAVEKSAASAASLAGFSSRDQVGCYRSLPGDPTTPEKILKINGCLPLGTLYSTRIKDAGIAIRHSRGYIISILQGPETDLREWTRCVDTQKKENHIKKTRFSYRKMF